MGPGPGKMTKKSYKGFGPKNATNQLHFPYSFKLTMSTIPLLHADLKINFDLKFLPTSKLDQNPLESDFNCIRGTGGMYSLFIDKCTEVRFASVLHIVIYSIAELRI